MSDHSAGLIAVIADHPVACNLLMAIMLLAGVWGLSRLNTQFFPTFDIEFVTISVKWSGASAEDVELAITEPIERELLGLDTVREMTSSSNRGSAVITLEYEEGSDMDVALDQVKERVASIRNLPGEADEPVIKRVINYEPVARLLVTGREGQNLRPIVREVERELIELGIAQVDIFGLPLEEIAIQVPSAALRELDMSLSDVARRVAATSVDLPAGNIGRDETSKQLRTLDQKRDAAGFERLALRSGDDGRFLALGDVATVKRRARKGEIRTRFEGRPSVSLLLSRAESSDSLESARVLHQWLDARRGGWPPGVEVSAYDESWELIRERTMLLLKNGAGGLVLVVAVLYLFLNARVAFWVAVGIPVSFMAALGVLFGLGGSINMVSLFALIMAFGIIVDDAIVVGEDALTKRQAGAAPLAAARDGARRMLAPVLASSLTTVAAFVPLMLVSGIIGKILFDIPLVVICVIIASVIESFLILPGHLHHTFRTSAGAGTSAFRRWFDNAFERFRDRTFRRWVTAAVRRPWTTLSCALAALLLCVGLIRGDRLAFNFFPTPEGQILFASVSFAAGTPPERVERFIGHLEYTMKETEAHFGEELVDIAVARLGQQERAGRQQGSRGDQFASLRVQLVEPDGRETRNTEFIAEWRERIEPAPGLESLSLTEVRGGPPGRDVEVSLTGNDPVGAEGRGPGVGVGAGDGAGRERYRGRHAVRPGAVHRPTDPAGERPGTDRFRGGRAAAFGLRRACRPDLPARGRGNRSSGGPARSRARRHREPGQPRRGAARWRRHAVAHRRRYRYETRLRHPAPRERTTGGQYLRGCGPRRHQHQCRGRGPGRGSPALARRALRGGLVVQGPARRTRRKRCPTWPGVRGSRSRSSIWCSPLSSPPMAGRWW